MPGGSSLVQTRKRRSRNALLRKINVCPAASCCCLPTAHIRLLLQECLLERLHGVVDRRLHLVVKSSLSCRALLRLLLLPYCRCTVCRLMHLLLLLHRWLWRYVLLLLLWSLPCCRLSLSLRRRHARQRLIRINHLQVVGDAPMRL